MHPRAARAADDLGPAERAYVASTLYAAVVRAFAHADALPGVDLERAYRDYLQAAMAASDRRGFDLASMAFLAGLKNGHTYFYDRWLGEHDAGPLGFQLEYLGNDWVVTQSRRAGLRAGDRVELLDGRPVGAAIAPMDRYLSASSTRALPFQLFAGWQPYLFPASFTLGLAGGRTVVIDRRARLLPGSEPRTAARWLETGRVAYLRLPSFMEPGFAAEALALLPRYAAARALVVDVRGNPGGTMPRPLLASLMNRPYRLMAHPAPRLFALAGTTLNVVSTAVSPSPYLSPMPGAFAGKLFFLTDGWCDSACESFLAPFKDNHRGVLVGERTQGSAGEPYERKLPNGMGFSIGAQRATMPDGTPFEGVGIAPDVPISPTAGDLARGRDVVLERALEVARGAE